MGDIICKWRVANIPNLIELVNMLPHEELPNEVFRERMEKQMKGFIRTPYQLACQLGLYHIDEKNKYVPRFRHNITEQEAEKYLHRWILRYYAPNPYTPSFRKDLLETKALVPALVDYAENFPEAKYEDACKDIFGEEVGNLNSILGAINSFSKVIEIDKNHYIHLKPNYKEIIMADRNNKTDFFHTFDDIEPERNEALQIIYYGAPGTGKSYTIDSMTTEDNSVRTTFHPDSDYASFVGSYKPTMEEVPISAIVGKDVHEAVPQGKHSGKEKKIVYKYVPQSFLKAYVEAWKRYAGEKDETETFDLPLYIGNDYSKDNGDNKTNKILPYYLIIEEINRGNCAQIFGDLFQLLDRNNMGSSSYPIHADEDIARFLREDEKGFAGLTASQRKSISHFKLVKDNREKREIGEDILNGKLLLLPPNLHIWATMNTSDQSLFPIDSAFKRRWDWEYTPISYNPKDKKTGEAINWTFEAGGNLYSWGEFLSKINPEIESLTESADKQMGYFFAKANPATDVISEKVFINKVLFYLWTEVLKDLDMGSGIFKNPDTNKSFKFTDFFDENQNAVINFLQNLKLTPLNPQNGNSSDDFEQLEDEEETDSETKDWNINFLTGVQKELPEKFFGYNSINKRYFGVSKKMGKGGELPGKIEYVFIVVKNKGICKLQFYDHSEKATELYDILYNHKEEIEAKTTSAGSIKWVRSKDIDREKHSEVTLVSHQFNFDNPVEYEQAQDWMAENGIRFFEIIKPYFSEFK